MRFQKPELVGRKREMDALQSSMDQAASGHGNAILISGEAGIGKSRLLEEFKDRASSDFSIYSGASDIDSNQPFMLFSSALLSVIETPLFAKEEYKSFTTVFAINNAGLLIAQASSEKEELDGDIFAGMLTAVQAFVRSSLGKEEASADLGRLEYGDLKIIIEHRSHIFVTAVFRGKEHADMKKSVQHVAKKIENEHADLLENWNGMMDHVQPINELISELASSRYLVRRDLEGLKLEEERLKIADRVLNLISALASSAPLLMVLEDLHWADESSLFVFEYIARNIKDQRIMILATCRPVEGGPLQKTMKNLIDQNCTIMPLIGLENNGLEGMLDATFPGHSFPVEFTRKIIDQCDGNPFFFLELLRQVWMDGNVIEENGKFILINTTVTIPASVEDLILKRLANLDPQAIALAEYSSCIGRSFTRDEAFSIGSLKEFTTAIQCLIDSGIILTHNGTVEFSHAIYQNVIYSGISERWKYSYHKTLGEYYESAFANNKSEVIYQLARHFYRGRMHEKALVYCIGAGEKAEIAFAAEQAIGFYQDALSLIPSFTDAKQSKGAEMNLRLRLGDLLVFTGQFDVAIGHYESMIPNENDPDKKADIIRKIAEVHLWRGEYEKSQELCESGLALLGGKICTEAERLYNTLGWTYIRTSRHSKAIEVLDKGLEIAIECNDKEGIASAEHNIGSVELHKGEYQKAMLHFEKALAIKEEIKDVWHLSSTLNNIGNSYMGLGDMLKALEYFEKSVENSRTIGDNHALSFSFSNMGNVTACLGDLNRAMDYYNQGLELKIKFDEKWGISTILESIGTLHFAFGEMEKALEHYQESLAIREKINDTAGVSLSHINIGEACYYTGNQERAYTHYREALEIAMKIDDKWLMIVANYHIAEYLLALGKIEDAHEHVDIALKISIETSSKPEEARSRQALGNVHIVEGNYELAVAEFDRVKEIFEETMEKGELAKLIHDYALLHLAMGETDTARGKLMQSLKLFEEGGATFFAEKCRKKLDEII